MEPFKEGLKVDNVVVRLVQAHDLGLVALEEAGMSYFVANAIAFQVQFASAAAAHSFPFSFTL